MMDFSAALSELKEGYRVTRAGWNVTGQYAVLQRGYPDGIAINANTAEATGLPEGTVCRFHQYLMLCMADGSSPSGTSFVPWQPTVRDILADDWFSASTDGTITWPDGTQA